jgi:glycosyltransferase involved in cell wall biosynthesis
MRREASLPISVVIATCDRTDMLLQAVRSVVSQPCSPLEIIVVDQSRSDACRAALQEQFKDEPIRYHHLDSTGASRARNFGLARASGEIVAFLDDDALAEPGWLEAIAEVFREQSDLALAGGPLRPLDDLPEPSWFPPPLRFLLGLYDGGLVRCPMPEGDQPIGANMAGRKDVLLAADGFPEQLGPDRSRWFQLSGEEALLSRRVRSSGGSVTYEPRMAARHVISGRKWTRRYLLQRSFSEGATNVQQKRLLGLMKPGSHEMILYARELLLAGARFVLPRYGSAFPWSSARIRMHALSRIALALGSATALVAMRNSK